MDADGDGLLTFGEFINYHVNSSSRVLEYRLAHGTYGLSPPLWNDKETALVTHGVMFATLLPSLCGLLVVYNTCEMHVWDNEFRHCITLQSSDCPAPVPHCIPLTAPPPVPQDQRWWAASTTRSFGATSASGLQFNGGATLPREGTLVVSASRPHTAAPSISTHLGVRLNVQTGEGVNGLGEGSLMVGVSELNSAVSVSAGDASLLSPSCEYVLQAGHSVGDSDHAVPSEGPSLLSTVHSQRARTALATILRTGTPGRQHPLANTMSPLGFTYAEATSSATAVQAAALMVEGLHQRSQWEAEHPERRAKWSAVHRRNAAERGHTAAANRLVDRLGSASVAGPGSSHDSYTHAATTLPQPLLSAIRASKAACAPRVKHADELTVTAVNFDRQNSR
jgi:hypothetical protein